MQIANTKTDIAAVFGDFEGLYFVNLLKTHRRRKSYKSCPKRPSRSETKWLC